MDVPKRSGKGVVRTREPVQVKIRGAEVSPSPSSPTLTTGRASGRPHQAVPRPLGMRIPSPRAYGANPRALSERLQSQEAK